jgi:hypothetical protein
MLKKIIIGAGALTLLATLIAGPAVFRHAKNAFCWARESVNDAVPLEYQLEQAERTIDDIIPEIEANKRVVAQEQVEIRYLGDEIDRLSKVQAEDGERIKVHNAALKTGRPEFVVAGRSYSRAVMENELRLALKKHQNNQSLLESKRRLLEARQRSLQAARQKLDTVVAEKENLAVAVEQLRAQLRETQALEATTNRFQLDDTKLAEVKEALARVRKRLDVAQQVIENEAGATIELPQDVPAVDVTVEVDRYFSNRAAPLQVACPVEGAALSGTN